MSRTTIINLENESVVKLMDGAKMYIVVMQDQPSEKGEFIGFYVHDCGEFFLCDHKEGDTLGIKEAWRYDKGYIYQADGAEGKFKPAFQLPIDGIRHWIRVKKVYAKRLNKITMAEIRSCGYKSKEDFIDGWKRKMKHKARALKSKGVPFEWKDNPWVWVYKYESTDKPEETRWD